VNGEGESIFIFVDFNISLLPIKCLVRSTEFVIVPPSNSMIMSPSCRLAREAGEELSNHRAFVRIIPSLE